MYSLFLHVVDHKRSLSFDDEDLEIVDGLGNIGRKMSLKLVVRVNLCQKLPKACHLCWEATVLRLDLDLL